MSIIPNFTNTLEEDLRYLVSIEKLSNQRLMEEVAQRYKEILYDHEHVYSCELNESNVGAVTKMEMTLSAAGLASLLEDYLTCHPKTKQVENGRDRYGNHEYKSVETPREERWPLGEMQMEVRPEGDKFVVRIGSSVLRDLRTKKNQAADKAEYEAK